MDREFENVSIYGPRFVIWLRKHFGEVASVCLLSGAVWSGVLWDSTSTTGCPKNHPSIFICKHCSFLHQLDYRTS